MKFYKIKNTILSHASTIKNLEILYNSKLFFSNCSWFTNIFTPKTLYFSLVKSKFENRSLIWCPIYASNKILNMNFQTCFMKFLAYIIYNTYSPRRYGHSSLFATFNIYSLEEYQIINSLE